MSGLKFITMTQLFWDTLEQHRGHRRYADMRARIAFSVERKIDDPTYRSNSEYPFYGKNLEGIWHAKLSVNPDVVMFYTVSSETINLAMVGSHHDYPHQGKNAQKALPLAKKIWTSLERGHVPSPGWSQIKWNVPADITWSFELEETTLDHLEEIENELKLEMQEAPIFERVHGQKLDDADIEVFTEWLAETDRALEAVDRAQERVRAISRGKEATSKPIKAFSPKFGS
jgi:mRNA-degrading endonuclease YafQ of YafQ-DinJ toxin-antitoxin module